MTDREDIDRFRPPEAPVEMPFQVLERQPAERPWLVVLRQAARGAPHE